MSAKKDNASEKRWSKLVELEANEMMKQSETEFKEDLRLGKLNIDEEADRTRQQFAKALAKVGLNPSGKAQKRELRAEVNSKKQKIPREIAAVRNKLDRMFKAPLNLEQGLMANKNLKSIDIENSSSPRRSIKHRKKKHVKK